jgi:hypothetical protein
VSVPVCDIQPISVCVFVCLIYTAGETAHVCKHGSSHSHGHGMVTVTLMVMATITVMMESVDGPRASNTSALCGTCAGILGERELGSVVHFPSGCLAKINTPRP